MREQEKDDHGAGLAAGGHDTPVVTPERQAHTPGPWEASGPHAKGQNVGHTNSWTCVQHNFTKPPYEGELCDEWGVYPPLGECGPVALVAGEANAHLISAAPELLEILKVVVSEIAGGSWRNLSGENARKALDAIAKAEGNVIGSGTVADAERAERTSRSAAQKNNSTQKNAGPQ